MNKDITTRFTEAKRIAMEKERALIKAKKEVIRARADLGEILSEAKHDRRIEYGQLSQSLKKSRLPQSHASYLTQARRGALSIIKMTRLFTEIMKIKTTQDKAA